jgi:hypothetical protein
MYLNHPLLPGVAITLRYGEERDREFLAGVFAEVWEEIPQIDRSAILARGYGQIAVDVLDMPGSQGLSEMRQDIQLTRLAVDTHPRNIIVYMVAHALGHKLDDFTHPDAAARKNESRRTVNRRIGVILQRWGYPAKPTAEFTPADELRIRANLESTGGNRSQGKALG